MVQAQGCASIILHTSTLCAHFARVHMQVVLVMDIWHPELDTPQKRARAKH